MERRRGDAKSDIPTRQLSPQRQGEVNSRKPEPSADQFCGAVLPGQYGRYSVQNKLAAGGMGAVYLADVEGSGEKVAVKVISPHMLDRPEDEKKAAIGRFFREAEAAVRIAHENVIKITDFGTYKENVFYVMEYLDGPNLKKIAAGQKDGKLPWEWLAAVMMEVCEGMHAAHNQNPPIIHRDLSPDNIVLASVNGETVVKIIDFGLAKFVHGGDAGLTKDGSIMGKADYMAPEQVLKAFGVTEPEKALRSVGVEDAARIVDELGAVSDYDCRVDIYALGVIMYRLLTGEMPFKNDNDNQRMLMRLYTEPQKPRDVCPSIPVELEGVILRAMERDWNRRYQTVSELKAAIEACMPKGSAPGIRSDDFVLSNILNALDRSGEGIAAGKTPSGGQKTAHDETHPQPSQSNRRKGSAFRRFMKWTVALGIIGTLGYEAYNYRHEIAQYARDFRARYIDGREEQPKPQPPPVPSSSTTAARQAEYLVTIDSVPAGAAVQELVDGRRNGAKVYLGTTPLQRRLPEGEHALLVSKPRYAAQVVIVSPTEHTVTVTLARGAARPRPGGTAPHTGRQAPAPERTPERPQAADSGAPAEETEPEEVPEGQ